MRRHGELIRHITPPTRDAVYTAKRECMRGTYEEPFVILGHISAFFPDAGISQYQLVISPKQADSYGNIDANEARELIERYDMHKIVVQKIDEYDTRIETGVVYEAPGDPFKAKWHGCGYTEDFIDIWRAVTSNAIAASEPNPLIREMKREYIWAEKIDRNILIYLPARVADWLRERIRNNSAIIKPLLLYTRRQTIKIIAINE